MKIEFHGLYGLLLWEEEEYSLFAALREHFSVLNPDRFHVEAFRQGYWDGKDHAINKDGRFLRGLAQAIADKIRAFDGQIDYIPYNRDWAARNFPYLPLVDSIFLEGIQLAEHQRRMTRCLLAMGGGTVEGVTGAGKTESIALLARILLEHTNRIFFIVHRIGLMRGARDRVTQRCPQLADVCGLLGDGERPKLTDRIIFSTVQSLTRVLGIGKRKGHGDPGLAKLWKSAGAIIIDEAHRVASESYIKVLAKASQVPIYQFSGTPETDDPVKDWTIQGVGGPIVARVKRSEMEAIGFIAEAVACIREFNFRADYLPDQRRKRKIEWMPKRADLSYEVEALKVVDGQLVPSRVTVDCLHGLLSEQDEYYLYPTYGRDMLFVQPERNQDIAAFVKASLEAERQPLLLCERVAQTYYLRQELLNAGVKEELIGLVHGTHPFNVRRETVNAFEAGSKPVLIASAVFDEGEDIMEVGSVVLASGGASLVKVVQRIGRGVRAKGQGIGNWVPLWFPVDMLTEFSREHTIARVSYLQRAEISLEEVGSREWSEVFNALEQKYGANPNRNQPVNQAA